MLPKITVLANIVKSNLKQMIPRSRRQRHSATVGSGHQPTEQQSRQSEEYLRQLAENISEVFWMTNPDKTEILYISQGYEEIWGRAREDLYQRPTSWMEAIHPDDRDRMIKSAMNDQVAGLYDDEYRILRPDGSIRWIRDRAFPVRNAFGQIYRITGIAEDITDQKLAEEALRASEERFRSYFELGLIGMAITSPTKGVLEVNDEICRILGYERSELLKNSWAEMTHPDDLAADVANFDRVLSGETDGYTLDKRFIRKDGQVIDTTISVKYLRRADGSVDYFVALLEDITERKRLEKRFRATVELAPTAMLMVNAGGSIILVNAGTEKLFGYRREELLGQPVDVLVPERLRSAHSHLRSQFFRNPEARGMGVGRDLFGLRKDGSEFPLEIGLKPIETEEGFFVLSAIVDITERKRTEQLMQQMAFYDTLTALPNRNNLYNCLLKAIRNANGSGKTLSMLLIDLNHFKEINNTLGHNCGDVVLKEVGARLQSVLFESDMVACLGGDKFAILLPHLTQAGDVNRVIQKIQKVLYPPILIEDLPIAVEASIGVAIYPDHGDTPDRLLQRADVAMYAAKKTGSSYIVYSPQYDQHSTARLALMAELRQAIEQNHLVLHYQPKIDLKNRKISGAEALVRWRHPQRGMIPPDQFIGLAERTGLIHPLTHWVLQTAIQQCGVWKQAGILLPLAVNLSARNLLDPKLPDQITRLLQEHSITPDWLSLEITESAIMAEPSRALETLLAIHRIGIQMSIDDFGIGYSSLNYLRKLPVNQLKVDKSFVINMMQNGGDAMIVRSTIDLAHNLGLEVVAEGVESEEVYNLLVEWGCDTAQGYYVSKPLPTKEFSHWIHKSSWGLNDAR